MTAESFLEKFELLALAPNAIEKMRELVLRLATSGRISGQYADDEPAARLLERLFAARDQKIAKGSARLRTEGRPIEGGDTIELPPTWERRMISEVCDLQTGATPSRQEPRYFGGDIRWLVSGDINQGQIRECEGRITKAGLENSNCKIITPGSVLIALNGQGKTRATVAVLHVPAALNQSLVAMTPFDPRLLLPDYIFWNLRGRYYAIRDITGQDQRRGLNMKLVGQLTLPIPPLAEQKRIVAKVDELMALCDRLEAQQKEREAKHAVLARAALVRFAEAPVPANLEYLFHFAYTIDTRQLRQSILTMAVQGKLVHQDPREGTAAQQLEVIQSKKAELVRAKVIKKSEPSPPVNVEELDHDVPRTWAWARLSEICELITDGTHLTPKYTESGRMFLSAQNVKPFRFMPAKHRFVSEEHYQGYIRNRKPTKGDILLTRVGAGIGEAATIDQDLDFAIYVSLGLIRTVGGLVFSDYITLWLNSPDGTEKSRRFTYGVGVSQGNLNLSLIRNFLVPFPPLAEQRRIVAKVYQLMELVDQLEAQLAESRAMGERLMEAVVAELTRPAGPDGAEAVTPPAVEPKPAAFDLFGQPDQSGNYLQTGATVAALVIQRMGKRNGKTFLEKNLHLVESFCDVPLGRKPRRMPYGPADLRQHDAIMDWAASNDVFLGEPSAEGKRVPYEKGDGFDPLIAAAGDLLGGKLKSVEALIAQLCPLSSKQSEWVATAYGSWNDYIKDGTADPSDEQIIHDIYTNWHVSKQAVPEKQWRWALGWLRENKVIPTGKGPRVLPSRE